VVAQREMAVTSLSASGNDQANVQMHVQMTLHACWTKGTMAGPFEPRESVVTFDQRDNSSTAMSTVSVTCVSDKRIHEVRELDIAPAARQGRYPTLCGRMITAASMAEPGQHRCHECVALRGDDPPQRPVGLLRRLVGR
jgi:hypothetical protein